MKFKVTRKRRGFTLIELMVVILIIAILAALVVPKIIGRTGEARTGAAKGDIAAIGTALDNFRLDVGRYPSSEEGLQVLTVPPSDAQGWKGPYSKKAIDKDPWGNPYIYEYPGAGGTETYSIKSYGSDGQPGGEGEALDVTSED